MSTEEELRIMQRAFDMEAAMLDGMLPPKPFFPSYEDLRRALQALVSDDAAENRYRARLQWLRYGALPKDQADLDKRQAGTVLINNSRLQCAYCNGAVFIYPDKPIGRVEHQEECPVRVARQLLK